MDVLKSCGTGIQVVAGYSTIVYHAYTIKKKRQPSESVSDDEALEGLVFVEGVLREQGILIHVDYVKRVLWVIEGASQPKLPQGVLNEEMAKEFTDYTFTSLSQSSLKATELSQFTPRPTIASSPSTAFPPTPTGTLRAMQTANLKSIMQNTNPTANQDQSFFSQPYDVHNLYSIFISAVLGTLSYHFAKSQELLPLGTSSFVRLHEDMANLDSLLSLDIYLTTSGHLVLSTKVRAVPELFPAASSLASVERASNVLVRLAPSGRVAMVEGEALSENGPLSQEDGITISWKSSVTTWLQCKGITLDHVGDGKRWLRVRVLNSTQRDTASRILPYGYDVFLWPLGLCFISSPMKPAAHSADVRKDPSIPLTGFSDALNWFKGGEDDGFVDSLHFVQEWVQDKPQRDKALQEQKRTHLDTEVTQKQIETQHNASSPFNMRGAAYGDLQALAGVYPTPPDGLVSQTGVSSDVLVTSGPLEARSSSFDSQGDDIDPMDIDLALAGDPQQNVTIQGSMKPDSATMKDDLFDFMEDEEAGGNDITDADFNFFDEPDGREDITLKVEPVSSPDEKPPFIDEEPHSRQLDGLNSHLTTPVAETTTLSQTNSKNVKIPESKVRSPSEEQLATNEDEGLRTRRLESVRPLTPTTLRRLTIDSSGESPYDVKHRRKSEWGPIAFNEALLRSDSRYQRTGTFSTSKPLQSPKSQQPSGKAAPFSTQTTMRKYPSAGTSGSSSEESDSDSGSMVNIITAEQDSIPQKSVTYDPGGKDTTFSTPASFVTSPPTTAREENPALLDPMSQSELIAVLLTIFEVEDYMSSNGSLKPMESVHFTLGGESNGALSPISVSSPLSPVSATTGSTVLKPTDKDFIQVAQMAADQIIFGTLDALCDSNEPFNMADDTECLQPAKDKIVDKAWAIVKGLFPVSTDCELLKYAALQDALTEHSQPAKNQPRPLQRRNTGSGPTDGSIPSVLAILLNSAHIRVRRLDGLWDLRPSVLPFWEPLGLAPTNGPKNIMTYCIYPANDDLQTQVDDFIDQLGSAYESCRMGVHVRGSKLCGFENGLLPLEVFQHYSYEQVLQALRKLCFAIGNQLAKVDVRKKQTSPKNDMSSHIDNFVIYVINPFTEGSALRDICHAFWMLYHTYITTPRSPTLPKRKSDLVLQIIPVKYVASPGAPVVLEPSTFNNLAREVYNRCPPAVPIDDPSRLRIPSAASIQLEENIPKSIQFKLTSDPPSDLLYENSHLLVGYAISEHCEWITAAWTDNAGKYQTTASYYLIGRTFFEIAREIWQTTLEIVSDRKVQWRVCIAKAGVVGREELEAWMALTAVGATSPIITIITSVDTDPSFSIFTKTALPSTLAPNSTSNVVTSTPVSTPQAGISPDTTGVTPATPSGVEAITDAIANDPDAHLVDITDETWALILGHRVNVSGNMKECRLSLSSGLMIKTAVDVGSDGPYRDESVRKLRMPLFAAVHLLWVGGAGRGPNHNNNNSSASNSSPASQTGSPAATSYFTGSTAAGSQETANAQSSNQQQAPQQWSGMLPKNTTDNLLREYMQMYRNLGLLARVRGMRATKQGLLPWHLAAAVRGANSLEAIMR